MSRKKTEKPTELELKALRVLWDKEESMTVSEIAEEMNQDGMEVSVASVAQVVTKLLGKNMLRVREHKLVSNVYARSFEPVLTREAYITEELCHLENVISSDRKAGIFTIFRILVESLGDDYEEVENVEKMLDDYRTLRW